MRARLKSLCAKSPLRSLLLLIGAAAAIILSVALVSQYQFGLHPCELCMKQRYPYMAIIVLAWAAAAFLREPKMLLRAALLCGALFVADAGVAGYHAGVEAGVFPGPTSCTSHAGANETIEEMRREIEEAPLVACDQPQGRFLCLTMAAWNTMTATACALITFFLAWRWKKRGAAL